MIRFFIFYRLNAYDVYVKKCFNYLLSNGNKWTKKIIRSSPQNYSLTSNFNLSSDMQNLINDNSLKYFTGDLLSVKTFDLNKINCTPLFFRLTYKNVCQIIATTDNNRLYLMFYFNNQYNKREFDLF